MTDLLELTISQVASTMERGEVSATEATEATIAQIERTEPIVHAYETIDVDGALRAAKRADQRRAAGSTIGPLDGIPIAVKDNLYTKDMATQAGSRVLADYQPPYDATAVARARDAGAVLLGKTVMHEFAWGVDEPPTESPWVAGMYPGGSSAGSGAAVAMRSAYGAIGTDSGGSIRVPAAVNGIVGLKPTYGRISRHGVIPMGVSLDHVGVLARSAEDCALLLNTLAGYDPADVGSIDEPVVDATYGIDDGAAGLVVGVERSHHFYEGLMPDVRSAVNQAVATYERLGATVVEVEMDGFDVMSGVGLTILLAETSAVHQDLLRSKREEYDPVTRQLLEIGEFVPATHYLRAQQARSALVEKVRMLFSYNRLDALLSPAIPTTTVPQAQLNEPGPNGETPMSGLVHHTFAANVLGLPAVSVPCGLSADDLPIGLQLMGRPFAEPTLMRLAHAYRDEWPPDRMRPTRLQELEQPGRSES